MLIKTYYNQRDIINEIQEETGYSFYEIERVLSTLEFFIQEKLIDNDNNIEIKVFPGFKIKSQVVSANQYNSNLCKNGIINSDYILKLNKFVIREEKSLILFKYELVRNPISFSSWAVHNSITIVLFYYFFYSYNVLGCGKICFATPRSLPLIYGGYSSIG